MIAIAVVTMKSVEARMIFAVWFGAIPLSRFRLSDIPTTAVTMVLTAANEIFANATFSSTSLFFIQAKRIKKNDVVVRAIGKCTSKRCGG